MHTHTHTHTQVSWWTSKCTTQIPLQGRTCCRDRPCPNLTFSASPHLMTDWGQGIKISHFGPKGATLRGHVRSRAELTKTVLGQHCSSMSPSAQSIPFYIFWPLINILHSKLHLSVCFQRTQSATHTHTHTHTPISTFIKIQVHTGPGGRWFIHGNIGSRETEWQGLSESP